MPMLSSSLQSIELSPRSSGLVLFTFHIEFFRLSSTEIYFFVLPPCSLLSYTRSSLTFLLLTGD